MAKDYRKIYEGKVERIIPSYWHIHHIDHDRSNNSWNNLLALPDFIHTDYHWMNDKFGGDKLIDLATGGVFLLEEVHDYVDVVGWISYCHNLEFNIGCDRRIGMDSVGIDSVYERQYKYIKQKYEE